ncbi:MAG: hypothetical protein RL217_1007 [Pseudomonadota bacterium]|jgi:uncharacterized protein YacL (UPF0231 family)
MDYQFYYNERQLPCARLSMEHEAFGLWLSEELSSDAQQCQALLDAITALIKGLRQEFQWQGHEFLLRLTREDAEVTALSLLQDYSLDELDSEEGLELYDAESRAICGLEDFQELLIEWQAFI